MMHQVSVIVPAFNAHDYLDAALQSLFQQQLDGLQIIVVDDGSTDATAQLLERYGSTITTVRQPNRGPAAARNQGLHLAEGDFLTFVDADDLWPGGRLQRQLAHLASHPDTHILLGRLQYVAETAQGLHGFGEPFHAMSFPSGIFRREAFESIGHLDESLRYCEDVDWFFRARRQGLRIDKEQAVSLLHRRHAANMTNNMDLVRHYTLKVLARHRRAGQPAEP